jgi:phosphatidylglycerol:prolipoprotein diacylglycerol transferase
VATSTVSVPVAARRGLLYGLANRTILYQRGDYIFVTFGLFSGIAALTGGTVAAWLLIASGVPPVETAALMAGILVGHLIPARAFLLPWRIQLIKDNPKAVIRTVEFVSWGGFAAIAAGLLLYAWLSSYPLIALTDVTVRAGVLGHAIGRIGCLALGCCYGRPTGLPFAVRYDSPHAKAVRVGGLQGIHIHPVPLYEAVYNLGLFVFLNAMAFAGAPQGIPTAAYLVLYGGGRFALETLRHNHVSEWIGPFHRNQWFSLVMIASGLALFAVMAPFSGPGAPSLSGALPEALAVSPVIAASSLVVGLVYSLHRGSIGRW